MKVEPHRDKLKDRRGRVYQTRDRPVRVGQSEQDFVK